MFSGHKKAYHSLWFIEETSVPSCIVFSHVHRHKNNDIRQPGVNGGLECVSINISVVLPVEQIQCITSYAIYK